MTPIEQIYYLRLGDGPTADEISMVEQIYRKALKREGRSDDDHYQLYRVAAWLDKHDRIAVDLLRMNEVENTRVQQKDVATS